MSLPEQIKSQVDAAKAITDKFYGPAPDAKSEAESTVPVVDAAVVPGSSVGNEAPPTQAAPQAEDQNSPSYAQRWRSLQGIHHSQQVQLQQALARVTQLEGLITTLQATPPVQRQAPVEATQASPHVTAKDVEDYGQDMVDFATRVSRQENARLQAELDQTKQILAGMEQRLNGLSQVVPTVQRVAQNQQVSAEQAFWQGVSGALPQWETINDNPQFHDWLLTPDPLTGITRQTYLDDAQKNLDVRRVVSIFSAFAPVAGNTPQPKPTVQAVTELERQIAPGRTLASNAAATQEAKRWTRQEIAQFYDDQRRGVYKGREADFQAIQRDIFLAQTDGRIAA